MALSPQTEAAEPTFNAQHERMVEGLRKAGIPEGDKKPN